MALFLYLFIVDYLEYLLESDEGVFIVDYLGCLLESDEGVIKITLLDGHSQIANEEFADDTALHYTCIILNRHPGEP